MPYYPAHPRYERTGPSSDPYDVERRRMAEDARARVAGPSSPTADGPCPDCRRPVPAASERNGAACGCDHADPCQMHAAEPARPYYHRACARRELRRRVARAFTRSALAAWNSENPEHRMTYAEARTWTERPE